MGARNGSLPEAAALLRVNSTFHASTCAQLWALGMGRCLKRSRSSMATTLHTHQRAPNCGCEKRKRAEARFPTIASGFLCVLFLAAEKGTGDAENIVETEAVA